MKSFVGSFTSNNHQENVAATIIFSPKYLSIGYNNEAGLHQQNTWNYKDISYRYDMATSNTVIENTILKQTIFIPEKNTVKDLDDAIAYDNKNWLAKKMGSDGWKLFAVFLFFVALIISIYLFLVPRLSDKLAQTMPISTEVKMGEAIYKSLVDSTKIAVKETAVLNEYFQALDVKGDYKVKITVLNDETTNAFAIMGGNIVVYSGLLKKLESHEALAALLGHEYTHISKRHTTRSLCRALGNRIFLSLLFGDMGGATSIIIENANELGSLKYSRNLEEEADRLGLELLDTHGIDGNGFVALFNALKMGGDNGGSEMLSSHPDIENRISYLKKDKHFTTGKTSLLNDKLKAIFAQLKEKEASGAY